MKTIKVSKQVHSFVVSIVKSLSEKLLVKGYTAKTCDAALFAKISQQGLVSMISGMFENGFTVETAVSNLIATLKL